jgi:type IX secretion system PorP/SprF family membrane protein
MKKYFLHIYLIIFHLFMVVLSSFAQDPHYSNWQMSPINQNAANTGLFEGDGRLIFNYRNQWRSVKVPYNSFSFGGDFNLNKPLLKNTQQAVGIIFNRDVAGDGQYSVTDAKIPFSTKLNFNKDTNLTISVGVLAGIMNVNVFSNKLSYDRQWDGDAYNANLNNGENFNQQSKTVFDASAGVIIQKKFTPKIMATVGYGLNHFTQPNISFNKTQGVLLRYRHSESAQLKYSFSSLASVMLEYYGNQQQAFKENLVGLSYYYTINPKTQTKLNIGLLNRFKDAAIVTVGLEHNNMRAQVSYDYNYSQFKRATNGKGAFEISLIYIYAKPRVFVPKTRVCPIFM